MTPSLVSRLSSSRLAVTSCASAGKLKDFFGKGSASESVDETTVNVGTAEEDATSTSSSAASTATVVSKKEPIPLEIEATFPTLQPMSVAEKRLGRDRLVVHAYVSTCARLKRSLRLKAIDAEETSKRDRKSTRLNSSHSGESRMPSSA